MEQRIKKAHDVFNAVAKVVSEHEDVRIVTDVGMSAFSGFGDLIDYQWDETEKTIVLIFD